MSAPGTVRKSAWTGFTGLLLLVTADCGDSNDPGGGGGGDLVSQLIGPEGGTVRTPDGQLTLIFSAGAVTQTQTITINDLPLSQLGAEFSDLRAERAYQLGPEGLAFQQPVTVSVPSEAQVDQPDGTIQVSMGLLFTSAGGQAEALDSLRLELVEGGVRLRGELTHFSPLVKSNQTSTLTITGVPYTLGVNATFTAQVRLTVTERVDAETAIYFQEVFAPIKALQPAERLALEESAPNQFQGSFDYSCEPPGGTGIFFPGVVYSGRISGTTALKEFALIVRRNITCVEIPAPEPVLTALGSIDLNKRLSAYASARLTQGYFALALGNGADVIDFSNPAQPVLEPGGVSSFCPGTHSAFFFDPFGATNPVFLALRRSPPNACIGEVPPGPPEIARLSAPPGDGAAIPGTHDFGFALDRPSAATLQIVHFGETPGPTDFIDLSSGRGCPNGLAATASKVYVVLSSGPNGTLHPECSVNGNKLVIVDLATKQPAMVPLDGNPQDVALTPDGSAAYITDGSAGGFIWTFDPQLGVAVRRLPQTFGPNFRVRPLDNRYLAVANGTSNTLQVLDVTSGNEIANVPSGGIGPFDVDVAPDGSVIVPHADGNINVWRFTPPSTP